MLVGAPKEIKIDEFRVGLIPSTVADLVARGHAVAIETQAGEGAGIGDDEYAVVGAEKGACVVRRPSVFGRGVQIPLLRGDQSSRPSKRNLEFPAFERL